MTTLAAVALLLACSWSAPGPVGAFAEDQVAAEAATRVERARSASRRLRRALRSGPAARPVARRRRTAPYPERPDRPGWLDETLERAPPAPPS